jgi:hypothetical protein
MVNNNENLTLKYLLNAFKNIARLMEVLHIHEEMHFYYTTPVHAPTVLTETTGGWNGLNKNFLVFLTRSVLSNSRKHCISRR